MRTILHVLAGTAVGALLVRELRAVRASERVAAAALESLLNAIDANDEETGRHVRRVASYALVLADALALDERACRSVERIALFHDIGKIHEALFDIIHEHTRLTRRERRAIATHPQRGADVLAPLSPFYPDLAAGVLAHHERWDGRGYPRHLRGVEIPLAARIVTLADTFDAITHRRRYRSGRAPAVALDAILQGRGTQFDPDLVDLMLAPPVLRDLMRARHAAERLPRRRARSRPSGSTERHAPDVAFRWHSRTTARAPGPA